MPCTPGRWKSSSKKPAGEAFASEGAESPRIYNPHGDPESSITVWGYQQVLGKELCCGKLSFFFFSRSSDVSLHWFLLNVSLGQ